MVASKNGGKIRYAVVGLGHIAQAAVLPAFAHARSNSQLTALVSDDPQKLKSLGRRYKSTSSFHMMSMASAYAAASSTRFI